MFTGKQTAPKILRRNIKGLEVKVPLRGRKRSRYIYLDNAASTPALISVLDELDDYLDWYSGVHRGTGYKSLVSSALYDDAHTSVGQFVGADLSRDAVVMVKNTTEAINKLSFRLQLQPQDIVVGTAMEHHSNELPWRARAQFKYARIDEKGQLDVHHVKSLLEQHYPRVKLLAVCGASNVTGQVNDVHKLAAMAHEYKCRILVDGAQLVPHQSFDMKAHSDPEHIDFLAFSGHKIYSPFGIGVLIGPREFFVSGCPEYPGGGTVKLVRQDDIIWADPPDKDEAGSPNVVGAYALARTLRYLDRLGVETLAQYEQELTAYALEKLKMVRNLILYGAGRRVGVISFNIKGLPHALVGAVLCFEAGIGLRTGCFCAQRYVRHLLAMEEDDQQVEFYLQNRLDKVPGMVRVSLAAYNTRDEIDHLVKWLHRISDKSYEFRRRYQYSPTCNSLVPIDFPVDKVINNISNCGLSW